MSQRILQLWKQRIKKDGEGESLVKEKGGGEGSLHNLIHHHQHQLMVKVNILPRIRILKIIFHFHDIPLQNLDVKFDFFVYDGELNAKKLDNWVKQI